MHEVADALSRFPLKETTGIHKIVRVRASHRADNILGKYLGISIQSDKFDVVTEEFMEKWKKMQKSSMTMLFGMEGY